MRLAILGANGAGKSTLLWAIAGKLGLTQGSPARAGLRLGLFTQDLAQQIDPAKVALEVVMETQIDPAKAALDVVMETVI
ncbi:hypothetical protein T484DRAFT_1813699 [Baffinella frigidus]|nr:hypothetical protein T484DRAFT_1813699 [Cryptophyta sp. CCMP2293]